MADYEVWRGRYEAGEMSLFQIAKEMGIGYEGLKKYAARHGWVCPQRGRPAKKTGTSKVVPITRQRVKKRKFAQGIIEGKTQTKAAEDIGYSKSHAAAAGSKLMKDPEVQRELQSAFRQAAEQVGLTEQFLADALKRTIEKASADQAVLDKKGEPTGFYVFDGRTVVAAAKTAGEFMGVAAKAKEPDEQGAVPIGELAQ
jgi:hypothetical protein